jgi:hypothetical protein
MARFCGPIGYAETVKIRPGVMKDTIVEKIAYGDIIHNSKKSENSGGVNDNISISNQISIIADPYASQNFHSIKYAKFMGIAWKVLTVEVQYPRLILTLGDEYNGQKT